MRILQQNENMKKKIKQNWPVFKNMAGRSLQGLGWTFNTSVSHFLAYVWTHITRQLKRWLFKHPKDAESLLV